MTSGLRSGRSHTGQTPNTDRLGDLRAFGRTLIEKLIDFLFGAPPKPIPVKARKRR